MLEAIFNALPIGMKVILSLDSRMPLPERKIQEVQVRRVNPTLMHRFVAERWLTEHVNLGAIVLCFGNLPPLFKLRGHVVVFVQNRYLVDYVKLDGFPLTIKFRLWVERFWLNSRINNADEFIVQTLTMKRLLEVRTKGKIPVKVIPFMANNADYLRKVLPVKTQKKKYFDFLYVASGEPHKNHRQLIEAWILLANEGLFPSLQRTLNREHFKELCSWIEQMVEQCRLNVKNAGGVTHAQAHQLYNQASAFIYPSTFESFGLPLIEARQAGLPLLASELDFVRDVLDPEQTFDPDSAVSIARAVKRFLGLEEPPLPLQDGYGFMKYILKRTE